MKLREKHHCRPVALLDVSNILAHLCCHCLCWAIERTFPTKRTLIQSRLRALAATEVERAGLERWFRRGAAGGWRGHRTPLMHLLLNMELHIKLSWASHRSSYPTNWRAKLHAHTRAQTKHTHTHTKWLHHMSWFHKWYGWTSLTEQCTVLTHT